MASSEQKDRYDSGPNNWTPTDLPWLSVVPHHALLAAKAVSRLLRVSLRRRAEPGERRGNNQGRMVSRAPLPGRLCPAHSRQVQPGPEADAEDWRRCLQRGGPGRAPSTARGRPRSRLVLARPAPEQVCSATGIRLCTFAWEPTRATQGKANPGLACARKRVKSAELKPTTGWAAVTLP